MQPSCFGSFIEWTKVNGSSLFKVYKNESEDGFELITKTKNGSVNPTLGGIYDWLIRKMSSTVGHLLLKRHNCLEEHFNYQKIFLSTHSLFIFIGILNKWSIIRKIFEARIRQGFQKYPSHKMGIFWGLILPSRQM